MGRHSSPSVRFVTSDSRHPAAGAGGRRHRRGWRMRGARARRPGRLRAPLAARGAGGRKGHLDHVLVHPCRCHRNPPGLPGPGRPTLPACRSRALWRLRLPARRAGGPAPAQGIPCGRAAPAGGRRRPGGGRRAGTRRPGWSGLAHPTSAWASTAPDGSGSAGTAPTSWSTSTTARSPARAVDGDRRLRRPAGLGSTSSRSSWRPDTGESLVRRRARDRSGDGGHCRRSRPAWWSNGRPQQRSGAVHTTVVRRHLPCVGGCLLAGPRRRGRGAGRGRAGRPGRRAAATPWSTSTPVPASSRCCWPTTWARRGSVLAVERDRRACADAEYNGRARSQLRVQRASITPNLVEHGIGTTRSAGARPGPRGSGQGGHGRTGPGTPPPCDGWSTSRAIPRRSAGTLASCSMPAGPSHPCEPSTSSR